MNVAHLIEINALNYLCKQFCGRNVKWMSFFSLHCIQSKQFSNIKIHSHLMSWCKKCLQFLSSSMKHKFLCNWYFHSLNIFQFWVVIGVWFNQSREGKQKLSLCSMREKRKFRCCKRMWSLEHLWYVGKFFCAPPTISLFPFLNVETIFVCGWFFFVCFHYKKKSQIYLLRMRYIRVD